MEKYTTKLNPQTKKDLDELYKRFKPLPRYEIAYHCIHFFVETGYDPRHFAGSLPALEFQKLREEVQGYKDGTIAFLRSFEKQSLKPLLKNSHAIVYKLAEYLKDNDSTDGGNYFAPEPSTEQKKKPDWLKDMKKDTEAVVERKKAKDSDHAKELENYKIKYEKLEKRFHYLEKDYKSLVSKIKKESNLMKTLYVLDIDEVEYKEIIQKY